MLLLLAVIGERRLSRRASPDALTYEETGQTPVREEETAAINASSIAEYTGIPRETVRRKVNELIHKGWVSRDDNGDLVPTEKAAHDLAGSTDATLDYLGTILEAGEKLSKK
ncbi:MAG: helix-turn-helix domain-containing protein [Hyphomicrobiaceae bacterium]